MVFLNRESSGNLTTTQLILFIVYLRSFLYLHKETNQQQSGEESAAVHSPLRCWSACSRLPCAADKKADGSESRCRSAEPFLCFLLCCSAA